ncbi:probable leucine-rich repeat receptor-like protein kinase At1g68400 [Zingiber officinale]|uniref:probable leucine-rich repeat receptor-like protein kinase At1g68400 n=1 Tax=Zingiber officinale TaxID=94328 RepID=UPI001C4DAAA3|nr:probable leucine-rich repeat receptor-like protein kinase At1g68400 [Zingiber officinale]
MHDMDSLLFLFLPVLFNCVPYSVHCQQQLYHNERNDLLLLRDSLSSTRSLHDNWTGPPCHRDRSRWFGIECSDFKVVTISLSGIQLTGSLPPTALQNVLHLTALNLSGNALHGALPTLHGLVRLRSVALAENRFSGSIPEEFTSLLDLERLELQDNALSGAVPSLAQGRLAALNLSYNFLEGSIPRSLAARGFDASSFEHNPGLCGRPLRKPCHEETETPSMPPAVTSGARPATWMNSPSGRNKEVGSWLLVLVAAGAAGLAFAVVLCLMSYSNSRRHAADKAKAEAGAEAEAEGPEIITTKTIQQAKKKITDLSFSKIDKATFNLDDLLRSPAMVIGTGQIGNTFKVTLDSNEVVVVKRLKSMLALTKKELHKQMELLGKLRHENLVEIIAFHFSNDEKLIIYEYIVGNSLFHLLHENRGEARVPLKWSARLNIVKGIAQGLAFLHQCMPIRDKVPHANLKSSNIIIPSHLNHQPKLTDYGFHSVLPPSLANRLSIAKVPEYLHGRKLTPKADVYCFGLLVLEIVTGRVPSEGEEDLPKWVKLTVNNNWSSDLLDLEIVAETERHQEMLKLTRIALACTEVEPEQRPVMTDVVKRIEEIILTSSGR